MQSSALMNPSCPSLARIAVLLNTPLASQLFNGVFIVVIGSADVGLVMLNRLILSTGMYKFPYPVTITLVQLLITSLVVAGASQLTRWYRESLEFLESPDSEEKEALCSAPSDANRFRKNSIAQDVNPKGSDPTRRGWKEVREVLPLAIVFLTKVILENLFISRTQLPTYILLHVSIIPLSLLLTPIVDRTPHSVLSIWSAFLAGFSLLLASIPSQRHFTVGNTILGVLSSLFVALLPVLLLRTYDASFSSLMFQRQIASGLDTESGNSANPLRKKDELHVFWLVLRLTTMVSTALMAVVFLLSGELPDIFSNCYVLDMKILWLAIWGSGMLTGTVIILTLWLTRKTSAAVATFLFVPESCLEIVILNQFSLTLSNWTDIMMCWISTLYFMLEKGKESATKVTGSAQRFYCILRTMILPLVVYACVHYIAHLSQSVFSPSHVGSDHAPHINSDLDWLNRTRTMYSAKDDYLGTRPHVDTVANLTLMVNQCNEVEGGKGVDDVVNCLSYLSNTDYLSLPAAGNGMRASEQDPRKADFANADGHGNTLTRYIPPSLARSPTDSFTGTCAGPVIPFHVYWTGPASWRVELFIKAYLYTQNLPCSRLWLWLDCDIDSDCVGKMLYRDPIFQRFRPLVDRGDLVMKAWRFPLRVPVPSESNRTDAESYGDPEEDGERAISKGIFQDVNGQQWLMLNPTHLAFSPVVVSDAVRFIVLHQHGGLYCDMDVLLKRDMRPLLLPDPVTGPRPFAEQWVERCHPADYNTAVISLPANSSLSAYLLRGGLRMGLNFHPKIIGRMMWRDGRDGELKKLHNAVFDPLVTNLRREGTNTCTVPCHKNFKSAFMSRVEEASQEWSNYRGEQFSTSNTTSLVGGNGSHEDLDLPPTNRSMENFFRGAWAYHIHNQWWKSPEPWSWMDVIMQAQNGFFDGRRMNLYGEYWNGPKLQPYDTIY